MYHPYMYHPNFSSVSVEGVECSALLKNQVTFVKDYGIEFKNSSVWSYESIKRVEVYTEWKQGHEAWKHTEILSII